MIVLATSIVTRLEEHEVQRYPAALMWLMKSLAEEE
jgi:hypothetical protein